MRWLVEAEEHRAGRYAIHRVRRRTPDVVIIMIVRVADAGDAVPDENRGVISLDSRRVQR